MNKTELLRIKQGYSLDMKIELTKQAIREFVSEYGTDGVFVSFSGGKDSLVLLHIVHSMYGDDVPAVFSNTKNEYDSIVRFVEDTRKWHSNIEVVLPDMDIGAVIKKYGYPVVSKKVSAQVRCLQNPTPKNEASRVLYNTGMKLDGTFSTHFKLAQKHRHLIDCGFKISDICCEKLKKEPMKKYTKKTGRHAIIGTLAEESSSRTASYLSTGCNNFKKGKSTPMGFWTEQDVLTYIRDNELSMATVYGDIVEEDGVLRTTGVSRTGCVACLLGIQFDPDRLLNLKKVEPKKHHYVVYTLGFKDILDYLGIKYEEDSDGN